MTENTWQYLRRFTAYGLFIAALFGITALAARAEGLSPLSHHPRLELPLMLYLYFLLRQWLQGQRWRGWIAALPLLTVYAMFDSYYLVFKRVLRLTEFNEVSELLGVMPLSMSIPAVVIIVLPFLWLLLNVRLRRPLRLVLASLPLLALLLTMTLRPEWWLQVFTRVAQPVVVWSDERSVDANGRVSMLLYHETARRAALQTAANYVNDPVYEERYQQALATVRAGLQPRNLHLLVLEGFVDPTLFANIRISPDPLVPEFRRLLVNGRGNVSISPTWGGYTAQPEFEILCGAPALQKLSTIEFNLFSGAPVHCLPELLSASGYHSVSSRGFKPFFFNSLPAMRGMGFDDIYYAREYAPNRDSYLSTGDVDKEQYMFDSHMLGQNREYLQTQQASSTQPLFNYVLTIYGHFPFVMDETLRPRVLTFSGSEKLDDEQQTLFNQIYYRSRALAEHIQQLIAADPDSLIVMVSDHLPPMQERRKAYTRLGYLKGDTQADYKTLLAVIDRGEPVDVGTLHQYDISRMILNRLTAGEYCKSMDCSARDPDELLLDYYRTLSHAVADAP